MMQKAQGECQSERTGARQAGTAEHHIDVVVLDVGPETAPQKLDHPLRTIFRMNAGAAEFQKSLARVTGEQRRDIELALAVEAAMFRRDLAAQQPVGADNLWLHPAEGIAGGEIDDQ